MVQPNINPFPASTSFIFQRNDTENVLALQAGGVSAHKLGDVWFVSAASSVARTITALQATLRSFLNTSPTRWLMLKPPPESDHHSYISVTFTTGDNKAVIL